MHDYDTDIKSYERRIAEKKKLLLSYLEYDNYQEVLMCAAQLISMSGCIDELNYQKDVQDAPVEVKRT